MINAEGSNTLYRLHERQGLRWNNGLLDHPAIDTFYAEMDAEGRRAATLATAIQINRPVNLVKCLRSLDICDGVVREVSDQEILDGKAQAGAGGFGCEPASGASIAGARRLREEGVIAPSDRVVCILTGHELKDPNVTVDYHSDADHSTANHSAASHSADSGKSDKTPAEASSPRFANRPIVVENDLEQIIAALRKFA